MFPGPQSLCLQSKIKRDKKKNLKIPSKYLPKLKHPKIIQTILQNIHMTPPIKLCNYQEKDHQV